MGKIEAKNRKGHQFEHEVPQQKRRPVDIGQTTQYVNSCTTGYPTDIKDFPVPQAQPYPNEFTYKPTTAAKSGQK